MVMVTVACPMRGDFLRDGSPFEKGGKSALGWISDLNTICYSLNYKINCFPVGGVVGF